MGLMEPLHQAPAVIPQIIMSLCTISIATCNKICEIMTPFYGGNKTRPRINVTTGAKTFNRLFDTGAAIICMSADSFKDAFKTTRPKLLKQDQKCMAANGSKMNSLGVFEIPMTIRGEIFCTRWLSWKI
jgi:hypothetical protein